MTHIQVPESVPQLPVSIILAKNPTDVIQLNVYIKKLKKINEVIKLVSEHFTCKS
jgi:hypothetical protein